MTDPLVSILVPTYNGERFLRIALRSAVEQSWKNVEIIVGDDASTDRTPDILAEFAAADPRITVIRHPANVGGFENPRLLLAEARGEYVKFLLHDDVLATDCVRDLVRGLQSAPDASMAFSRRILIDENGKQLTPELAALRDRPGLLDGRDLGDAMLESCTNVVGELTTVLFRRSDVDVRQLWRADGRQLGALGDMQLWLHLLSRGPAFYTPRTLSRFRVHGGQSSSNPDVVATGVRDWPRLIDWGTRNGYLADPARQRRAQAKALQMSAARVAQLAMGPDLGRALEAVHLSTARLLELACATSPMPDQDLPHRAHAPALLERFRQELDVWSREFPVALAAPALDACEVDATVQAFREVSAAGVAKRLLIAVPEPDLDEAAQLIQSALAQGLDIDLELVPTDLPATLLQQPWLAVAPRGSDWHDARATAVWAFDAG